MGVDRPLVRLERDALDGGQELRAGEDPPRLPRELEQQPELGRRELDAPAGDRREHARDVELDVAGAHELDGRVRSLGAPQHRPDARDELLGAERLGDVVVRAELEPDERVGLVGARGEHDDRHGRLAPDGAGHVEPVEPRQPEVEHDEVGPAGAQRVERGLAVAGAEHGVAGGAEIVAAERDDLGLVVDDEDRLHRDNRSRRRARASLPAPRPAFSGLARLVVGGARAAAAAAAAVSARAEADEPGDRDDGQHDQAGDEDGREQREEYESSEDSHDDVRAGSSLWCRECMSSPSVRISLATVGSGCEGVVRAAPEGVWRVVE